MVARAARVQAVRVQVGGVAAAVTVGDSQLRAAARAIAGRWTRGGQCAVLCVQLVRVRALKRGDMAAEPYPPCSPKSWCPLPIWLQAVCCCPFTHLPLLFPPTGLVSPSDLAAECVLPALGRLGECAEAVAEAVEASWGQR